MSDVDPSFLALPLTALAEAALDRAGELGATHADFRLERIRGQHLGVRDGAVQGITDSEDLGFAVRVVHRGAWGFAAGVRLTADEARRVAETAIGVAEVAARMTRVPVELAPEPAYPGVTWSSAYDIDPFTVPTPEKAARLVDWSNRLLESAGVEHATASLDQVHECKHYADLAGSSITQQRIRLMPAFEAMGSDAGSGVFDSMASIAPPAGRGWEYVADNTHWDWDAELAEVPGLLAEKLAAPSVEAGTYDLVIHPSNLWLTIHESVGHATELDRALGYEANYAGTSFATPDKLGTLRYGSELMNIRGDRNVEHGLATIGYDDDGVATGEWDIVRDGTLVGYQLDRVMGAAMPGLGGAGPQARSNGCAFADSPGHIPIQRMANVSLMPAADGPDTDGLIAGVERGLYVVGDKSWSIDMQRYNFQFTGQRFFKITDGRLDGQVRDAAYQATTTDFWGSMDAVGGESTWLLGGAFNCGKAQPGQVAAVSHGCPSARFRDIRILNTQSEANR